MILRSVVVDTDQSEMTGCEIIDGMGNYDSETVSVTFIARVNEGIL